MTEAPHYTIALVLATPGTTWGGMEKHTAELADGLAGRGHDVHVIAHRNYRHRFAKTVRFHHSPLQLGRRNPWLRFRLRQTIRAISPDILHAQGNKAATLIGHIGRHHAVTLGTIHGTKTSLRAFNAVEGVIAVNDSLTSALNHPQVRVIPNGVRLTDTDAPPRFAVPEQGSFALAIGRLEPVKQFDRLIDAWARLDTRQPLYILGDGSERRHLEQRIANLGLTDRVFLPGYEDTIQPWLNAASVCLISSAREGFPYALIEALAAGCPVLATPVSGARDLLPADCLARSASTEDLYQLLRQHLDASDHLRQHQQSCFQRARADYGLDTMIRRTDAFYRELLATRAEAGRRS